MKLIDVLDGGLLTTVQDLGRYGYQRYGVPVSGAMDALALRAANRLVGNEESEAGLEVTLLGPRLRFLSAATIALTGADLGADLDGRPAPRWASFVVPEGSTLSFQGPRDGARAYLAVAGGLDVPLVLGSRSTYVRSKLGGLDGRPLRAGDEIATGAGRSSSFPPRANLDVRATLDQSRWPVYGHDHVLRVVLGPQDDRFSEEGIRTFLSSEYRVTPQSDRMGYRFSGPKIAHTIGPDIVSDGTPLGAVQVAGDGVPIVLMADRGTAGGYTKIATVISVDVARLSQATPGDVVRFSAITIDEAHAALRRQDTWLESLREATAGRADRRRRAAAAAAAVARHITESGD